MTPTPPHLVWLLLLAGCATQSPGSKHSAGDTAPLCDPEAEELCDGIDQDCDGEIDEDLPLIQWYLDEDGDGHAGTLGPEQCGPPSETATEEPTDCDDADPEVHPEATEVCSGRDEDCDGLVDDEDPSWEEASGTPWYADADGDGYGGPVPTYACEAPKGRIANGEDCDDSDPAISPEAVETCDFVDEDCDGVVDPEGVCDWEWAEHVMHARWYPDEDNSAGYSVDVPGDINGDGEQDLIISSIVGSGPPYATSWITDGLGSGDMPLSSENTLAILQVGADGIDFDATLGCDLDDNGTIDLALGSAQGYPPSWEPYPGYGSGLAYIVYEPAGDYALDTEADAWLIGSSPDASGLGAGLACGDLDLDGSNDLVVGTVSPLPGGGAIVIDGQLAGEVAPEDEGWILRSTDYGAQAGEDVAVGDVTGDGVDDLLLGANGMDGLSAGAMGGGYLVHGPITSDLSLDDADTKWVGESSGGHAGGDVDIMGDQDGDGIADMLFGSDSEAYILNGPPASGTQRLDHSDVRLEHALAYGQAVSGGDYNGDGYADAALGGGEFGWVDGIGGMVSVAMGPMSGTVRLDASGQNYVTSTWTTLGRSLASGDVDEDGLDDLWIGATGDSTFASLHGAGYLLLGADL